MEHRKGHAKRLKAMLESAPAHRLADLFVASFEVGPGGFCPTRHVVPFDSSDENSKCDG